MKKFFFFVLVLVVLGGSGFFLWKNRYQYFFQQDEEASSENQEGESFLKKIKTNFEKKDQMIEEMENEGEAGSPEKETEEDLTDKSSEIGKEPFSPQKKFIAEDYCSKECQEYQGDKDQYEYCREICGFNDWKITTEEVEKDDCASASGQERDFCFRAKAIAEKNMSFCEKIADEKIKESCY